MNRQLPLISIDGTAFFVDVIHDCLRQQLNLENRIPFEVFEQHGDGYSFLYDRKQKCAVTDQGHPEENSRYVKITIPALMELDPQGIALKYHIPLEMLCPENRIDYLNQDEDDFYGEEIFE